MQPPPNFQPKNVNHGTKLPPAVRSRYRKFDIYRDVTQFSYVDNHAIVVSYCSFSALYYSLSNRKTSHIQVSLIERRLIYQSQRFKDVFTLIYLSQRLKDVLYTSLSDRKMSHIQVSLIERRLIYQSQQFKDVSYTSLSNRKTSYIPVSAIERHLIYQSH